MQAELVGDAEQTQTHHRHAGEMGILRLLALAPQLMLS
jgi:hypothetical protein